VTPAWDQLSEDCQLLLAQEAMQRACEIVAARADALAEEFDRGDIADRGGADALRLLARLVRLARQRAEGVVGHA
jgi:hypothetical protein